jgi:hypothetical protein
MKYRTFCKWKSRWNKSNQNNINYLIVKIKYINYDNNTKKITGFDISLANGIRFTTKYLNDSHPDRIGNYTIESDIKNTELNHEYINFIKFWSDTFEDSVGWKIEKYKFEGNICKLLTHNGCQTDLKIMNREEWYACNFTLADDNKLPKLIKINNGLRYTEKDKLRDEYIDSFLKIN